MKAKKDCIVPAARMNYFEPKEPGNFKGMAHKDDTHPLPINWIAANASRFYFTNKQIIEAALPEFVEHDLESKCRLWAVYFLINDGEIVYVGQSSCMAHRIEQHRESGKIFTGIAWVEVPALFINDIEAFYIWRCNPIYNEKWPPYGEFGEAARLLDEQHGEKRNDAEYVVVINSPALSLPW